MALPFLFLIAENSHCAVLYPSTKTRMSASIAYIYIQVSYCSRRILLTSCGISVVQQRNVSIAGVTVLWEVTKDRV